MLDKKLTVMFKLKEVLENATQRSKEKKETDKMTLKQNTEVRTYRYSRHIIEIHYLYSILLCATKLCQILLQYKRKPMIMIMQNILCFVSSSKSRTIQSDSINDIRTASQSTITNGC